MRDKHDTDTTDLWEPPKLITHAEILAHLPRVRIFTYQIDGRTHQQITLVGHPKLPPLGGRELERAGRIVDVLTQRMRWHQAQAKQRGFRSPELMGRNQEELHHAMMVNRYRDAILEFKQAERLAALRPDPLSLHDWR